MYFLSNAGCELKHFGRSPKAARYSHRSVPHNCFSKITDVASQKGALGRELIGGKAEKGRVATTRFVRALLVQSIVTCNCTTQVVIHSGRRGTQYFIVVLALTTKLGSYVAVQFVSGNSKKKIVVSIFVRHQVLTGILITFS